MAHNTPRGIVAASESYLKDRYTVPVDIYIAPEIRFITETEVPHVNNSLAEDLDKISNSASYFARWEAYNELSKKLLEQEISRDLKSILETDKEATVGIITFYSAQASKIKQSLEMILNDEESSRVEVGTVDAFQGKEFDYVMLSCVRSNRPKDDNEKPVVGFLEKPNRLCVAFSRAVRQLIVYGDAETLIQIPCFSNLYDICTNGKGGYYREY